MKHLRVVEFACGNGHLARRKITSGAATVVGVDPSVASIRIARGRERRNRTGERLGRAGAARLPLPAGATDLVPAITALMDFDDARGANREVALLLEPGGRVVVSTSHPGFDLDHRSAWVIEREIGPAGAYDKTVWRRVRGHRVERRSMTSWQVAPKNVVRTESFRRTLATDSRYLRSARFVVTRTE